jgi:hypothetical protein
MRHEAHKIGKIVDEIVTYFLHGYGAETTMRVTPKADRYEMHFRFDNVSISEEEFAELDKLLVVKRQPELEDYYWQLAGEIDTGNELMLIGMMCDELKLSRDGTTVSLDLVRKVS